MIDIFRGNDRLFVEDYYDDTENIYFEKSNIPLMNSINKSFDACFEAFSTKTKRFYGIKKQ